jgi:hypothetical protein
LDLVEPPLERSQVVPEDDCVDVAPENDGDPGRWLNRVASCFIDQLSANVDPPIRRVNGGTRFE